jgi:23S rRNA (cytosine1962-C5)-methyltransferase
MKEGYPARVITLAGSSPPESIPIREGQMKFLVDVYKGHKTGFYLDQSLNRKALINYCRDKYVLNAFSYSGGFGVAAMLAGAKSVTNVDTSEEALELARLNYLENNIKEGTEFVSEDVFRLFRTYRDASKDFDVIILDPPKFVASASQLAGGSRGYKDINLLAFKLLKPGGILVTFSCSGYVKPDLFQKIVADAALDAGRNARILEYLNQAPDHPVALNYPEGLYLKGLVCQAD